MEENGYCVVCQDAHKMIDSCLKDVQCKNCSKKVHLRIDCPQDSSTNEEIENKTGRGIKRKAQVVEGNIGNKVCPEVLSKSFRLINESKIDLESNDVRIIASDSIKVEHQDSMKQEYYEDHILMKKEKCEYFEETTPDSVKSEKIGDHPNSSTSDTKPVDNSDNPVLEESAPPVPVKWTPTNAKFWQLLKKQKSMFVLCPGYKCNSTQVNISNIARHILKVHPNFQDKIFCKFCQGIVFPKDVSKHMPKCSSTTSLGKTWLTAQKSSTIPKTSPDLNSKFWQKGPHNTLLCPIENCDVTAYFQFHEMSMHIERYHPGMIADNIFCQFCKQIVIPPQVTIHMQTCSLYIPLVSVFPWNGTELREDFPDIPLLPGLSAVPIDSDGLSFFSAKIFLDFYLVKNFMVSKADTIKCSWMFMNYMETSKVKGRKEVLSPTRFLLVVKELSCDKWGKDVGPFRIEQSDMFGSLYFTGLKLKGLDM